ncbi:MAG: tripartite tricarboxylate transporter TctB family protein [Smithellaceae bacterium]|nr:tripartite tricarboxylate transporter TctB family protein [Smithellaceae bacterium]
MSERQSVKPGEKPFLWLLVLLSLAVLSYSFTLPHGNLSSPGTFPLLTGTVLLLSALNILWAKRKISTEERLWGELRQAGSLVFPKTVTIFTLILILYILLLQPLHFIFSSYLFLVGSFIFLKGTTWLRAFLIAAGVLGGIFLLFQYIFKVILW